MEILSNLTGSVFETGYQVLEDKGLAIVGMSPRNSYFKRDKIHELLQFCSDKFSSVKIMVPDKPSEHTYKAIGYEATDAERKARLAGNTLQNHSRSSIDAIVEEEEDVNIDLIEWKDEIEPHEAYQYELQKIERLYEDDETFRNGVRDATRAVIEGELRTEVELEKSIDEGVNYLLKEFAFLTASPKMFGVEKVAYTYHDRWQIFEDFVNGVFNGDVRSDLGFVVVR